MGECLTMLSLLIGIECNKILPNIASSYMRSTHDVRWRLMRNGQVFKEMMGKQFALEIDQSGNYRVEACYDWVTTSRFGFFPIPSM